MKTLPIPWSRDMPDDPMAVTPAKVVMGQLTRLNFGYRGLGSVVPAPGTVEVFITVGTPAGDLIYHSPGNTTNTVQIGADNNFYLDLTATELSLPPDLVYCVEARDTTPGSETVLARRRFEVEASAAFSPLLPPPLLIIGLNLGGTNANLAGAPDGVVFKAGAGMVVHALDPATLAVVGGVLTAIGGGGGGSAVPTTRVITINGTALDLSADRTFTITDANLSISDITTNNVSTAKHGFAPKAPNDATKFLDGTGAYSTPAGGMSIGGDVTGGTAGLVPYIAAGPVLAQKSTLAFDGSTDTLTTGGVRVSAGTVTSVAIGNSSTIGIYFATNSGRLAVVGADVLEWNSSGHIVARGDIGYGFAASFSVGGNTVPDLKVVRLAAGVAGITDGGAGFGKLCVGTGTSAGQLTVVAGSASTVPIIAQGTTSQAGNLIEGRTVGSPGTTVFAVTAAGNIQLNQSAGSPSEPNVLYLGSTAQSLGFIAGTTVSSGFAGASGAFFGARGNTYSAVANQRGNLFFGAGIPSAPGAAEGQLRFITNDTIRMVVDFTGYVGVLAGTSTQFAKVGGAIFDHYTDGGSVGTAETTLATDTIAANTLATNGDKIKATYGLTLANSASTKQPKLYFAGSAIWSPGAYSTSDTGFVEIRVTLVRVSATVVRFTVGVLIYTGALSTAMNIGELTGLTLSGSNILKVTGTAAGGAAADNDLVCKLASVKWSPAA